MSDKPKVIKKTNINGEMVVMPVNKVAPIKIDKTVEVSELLTLSDQVIYSQLTRYLAIGREKTFNEQDAYVFGMLVKSVVEIQKIRKLELKDLNLEGMSQEELIKLAEKYITTDIKE